MTDNRRSKLSTGQQVAPGQSLEDAAARLEALREEGERLVEVAASDGSWRRTFEHWRRRWDVSLGEVQALCWSQAPLQFEMIKWPLRVGGDAAPPVVAGLMRTAATGTRELRLLAYQLVDVRLGERADTQDVPDHDEMSNIGTRYFRSGQRFEGAIEIRRLIQQAQHSILVVDGYIAEETFILANAAPSRVSRRFLMLSNRRQTGMALVVEAWTKWASSWSEGGAECRVVHRSLLPHTRYLYVDGARYHFDASLKDFGQRFTHFRLLHPSEVREVEAAVTAAWAAAVPLQVQTDSGACAAKPTAL